MNSEAIQELLSIFKNEYKDSRIHLVDIQPAFMEGSRFCLQGRVLDQETLHALQQHLSSALPALEVDYVEVRVLRSASPTVLQVATNLTSVHAEPSWLSEMLSQCTYGTSLEILDEQGRWGLVRQADGYLGWIYRPYLTDHPTPAPNYIITSPATEIRAEPNAASPLHSRLVGGTMVQVVSTRSGWAEIDANTWGWVPLSDLRALQDMPISACQRRKAMIEDSAKMIGVPYLWGGTSVNGIDCSGFAQLLHRWNGLTIPRDADMQYASGVKIEPPFQSGDLLFFGEQGEERKITHVAISLGGWHIIHSSRSRNGVYTDDVQEVEHLRGSFIGAATYLAQ